MADFRPTAPAILLRRPDMMTAPLAVSPTFSGKAEFLDLAKKLESLQPSASDQKEYQALLLALREAYLGPHQKAAMPGLPLETGQQVPLSETPMSKGASLTGKSPTVEEIPGKTPMGESMSDPNIILAKNLTAQISSVQHPVQERPLPSSRREPADSSPSTSAVSVSSGLTTPARVVISESLSLLDRLDESVGSLGIGALSEAANAKGLVSQLRRRISSLRAED